MASWLHIGNLSSSITGKDLVATFRKFGSVESVTISRDSITGTGNGTASVVMANDSQARVAAHVLNHSRLHNRIIFVTRYQIH